MKGIQRVAFVILIVEEVAVLVLEYYATYLKYTRTHMYSLAMLVVQILSVISLGL